MKQLIFIGFLSVLFAMPAMAQQTGRFCFNYVLPTQTVNGSPASSVGGVSKVYFEIARFTGSEVTYRDSMEVTDFTTPQACFDNVPVGPGLKFANRAYDIADCAGQVSPITTHEVFADREKLQPATVTIIVTGSQPEPVPAPIH